jgi:hypothetical protein
MGILNLFKTTALEKLQKGWRSALSSKTHKPIEDAFTKLSIQDRNSLVPNEQLINFGLIGKALREHVPPAVSISQICFFVAVAEEDLNFAKKCKDNGAIPWAHNNFALWLAADNNNVESIKYLRNNGVKGKSGLAAKALVTALENNNADTAREIISMGVALAPAVYAMRHLPLQELPNGTTKTGDIETLITRIVSPQDEVMADIPLPVFPQHRSSHHRSLS